MNYKYYYYKLLSILGIELWKDIDCGYLGLYQISNQGRVKSFIDNKGKRREKILKFYCNKKGYLNVTLCKNKIYKKKRIHQLVLLAFKGKSDLQCNHINGIKSDNRLENLEYCTPSENTRHAYKLSLINRKGEKNGYSKLKNEDVIFIRKNKNKYSKKELAEMFIISQKTISDILIDKTWVNI